MCSAGCAGYAFDSRGRGLIYSSAQANEMVTQNVVATKKGQACASSILGWITTGDASVATAAKSGGITKVAVVDQATTNILGLYATYCVNVTGELIVVPSTTS